MEAKNAELGSFLEKIGGAIHSQSVNIYPDKVAPGSSGPAMDLSAGRLPPHALKELFELQQAAAGKPPDVGHLIQKYNVPQERVSQVLSTYCLPVRVENPGNSTYSDFDDPFGVEKLSGIAGWPKWFKRSKA